MIGKYWIIQGKKTCPIASLSTTDTTWAGLGSNPGLHGKLSGTNHLCRGMTLNWDLHSGKLVIDHVSYGMAFSTRRVPSYSSCQSQPSTASLSSRYNLKMGAFHWAILSVFRSDKQNCFVSIIIHYLFVYIALQYIRGVSGPVHYPAVHQRCVRTCTLPCSTSEVCQDLYIALQYIRDVSGPVHCPAVHQRCVWTRNCLALRWLFM
jgi:hypothetical protein